jgi:hypothetical protein
LIQDEGLIFWEGDGISHCEKKVHMNMYLMVAELELFESTNTKAL